MSLHVYKVINNFWRNQRVAYNCIRKLLDAKGRSWSRKESPQGSQVSSYAWHPFHFSEHACNLNSVRVVLTSIALLRPPAPSQQEAFFEQVYCLLANMTPCLVPAPLVVSSLVKSNTYLDSVGLWRVSWRYSTKRISWVVLWLSCNWWWKLEQTEVLNSNLVHNSVWFDDWKNVCNCDRNSRELS